MAHLPLPGVRAGQPNHHAHHHAGGRAPSQGPSESWPPHHHGNLTLFSALPGASPPVGSALPARLRHGCGRGPASTTGTSEANRRRTARPQPPTSRTSASPRPLAAAPSPLPDLDHRPTTRLPAPRNRPVLDDRHHRAVPGLDRVGQGSTTASRGALPGTHRDAGSCRGDRSESDTVHRSPPLSDSPSFKQHSPSQLVSKESDRPSGFPPTPSHVHSSLT